MSQTRKTALSKFKLPFTRKGRGGGEERVNSLVDDVSVNGEYTKAFRTKSYIEMLRKAEDQLGRKSLGRLGSSLTSLPSLRAHLYTCLLEPRQETIMDMIEGSSLHPLIVDYFDASFEACKICDLLLRNVHLLRSRYTGSSISKILIDPLSQCTTNHTVMSRDLCASRFSLHPVLEDDKDFGDRESVACAGYTKAQCHTIIEELASFAMLKNPLLRTSPSQFRDMHNSNNRFGLVVSYSALAIGLLLVLACHSMVGIVAAPVLLAFSLGFVKKVLVRNLNKIGLKMRSLGAQLEKAERGVFTLNIGLDTMSQLVRKLQGEIEHIKAEIEHVKPDREVCVGNGMREVMKEVVRAFGIHQTGVLEQLEELEQQIYLCLLSMNRARAVIMQEIMVLPHEQR
ncbi:transmembrane protein [Actinidia rufa]|uniref:Transmembrane protein n=1 Tax=Actinidia rufa TaxID=165716 RepID=A0A7J0FAV7_9ERIC|nr:transmembrane protein [Actinidia rufa]